MQLPIDEMSERSLELKRNECFVFNGTTDTNVYFIESGCVKVCIDIDGSEQVIRFGYAGDLIAALDSYITGRPTSYYMTTIRACSAKVIPKSSIEAWVNESDENREAWMARLGHLIVEQMEREVDLLISSPNERFKRVLERSPRLFQEVPHKYIANYLRMTPETLSRIQKY